MLAANAALTAAVVYLSKDIKVQGDGTLQTDNGDAMTAGKKPDIPLIIHDATRRRLRMLDGKRRLEVMQVPEWACNAAKTFGVRTHDFEGFVEFALGGSGKIHIAHGEATGREGSTYTVQGVNPISVDTETYDVTITAGQQCSVSDPALLRQLRELTDEEVADVRRRRLEERAALPGAPTDLPYRPHNFRGCALYHCFEGDVDCEHPSQEPERDCLVWSDDEGGGRRCLEAMCMFVKKKQSVRRRTSSSCPTSYTLAANSTCRFHSRHVKNVIELTATMTNIITIHSATGTIRSTTRSAKNSFV